MLVIEFVVASPVLLHILVSLVDEPEYVSQLQ